MMKDVNIFLCESLNQHLEDIKYQPARYHLTASRHVSNTATTRALHKMCIVHS